MKYITSLSGPCCPGPEYQIDLSKSNVPLTTGGVENAHMKEKIVVIIDDPELVDIATIKTYPNTKITPLGEGKFEVVMPSSDIKIYGVTNYNPLPKTILTATFNVTDTSRHIPIFNVIYSDSISEIEIDGVIYLLEEISNGQYLFTTTGNHIVKYTLRDSVISFSMFAWIPMVSVIIPNNITNIGNYAFKRCESLTNITSLATTAPSIGNGALVTNHNSGTLIVPRGSTGYDEWIAQLGSGWTKVEQ